MNEPRALHVERTTEPTVMRWVTHNDRLAASPPGYRRPPTTSPLGQLVGSGSVTTIVAAGSNLDVAVADAASWREVAPMVRSALLDELDALEAGDEDWLVEPLDGIAGPLPSVATVQAVVDRAAGKLAASHGGTLTVVAVSPQEVTLRPGGACHGCSQSTDTVLGLVKPAVRAAFPAIATVALDEQPTTTQGVQFLGSNKRRTIGS